MLLLLLFIGSPLLLNVLLINVLLFTMLRLLLLLLFNELRLLLLLSILSMLAKPMSNSAEAGARAAQRKHDARCQSIDSMPHKLLLSRA